MPDQVIDQKRVRVRLRRATIIRWAARNDRPLKTVAVCMRMSPSYLSQLLGGYRHPNPQTRTRILRACKPLTWAELFEVV